MQQKTRSDYFFPGEVESYRHASEAQLGMPLSKLRVPVRRATQPGLLGEQEVVWLDDEGMEVSAPPGAPHILSGPTLPADCRPAGLGAFGVHGRSSWSGLLGPGPPVPDQVSSFCL